ncbi:MAG TPA: SRPBCC family protein [Acidimicrobiales bacterium]|nr:SRPBCC family protein [Acidimicrobiales bacterium]
MNTTATDVTTQVFRVHIKASPEEVWTAITDPDWTERYGYCTRSDYDLRPGGKYVSWTNDGMRAMGTGDVAVDGEVIEADPPRRLVQTWRLVMAPDAAAEGFTRVTWEIDGPKGGVTKLTVTHDLTGAPKLALYIAGDEGGGGGWAWILSDLKSLLETGEPMDKEWFTRG